jgi:hypothetical protein
MGDRRDVSEHRVHHADNLVPILRASPDFPMWPVVVFRIGP